MNSDIAFTRRGALARLIGGALALAGMRQAVSAPQTNQTVSFVVYLPTRPKAKKRMRHLMFAVLDEMSKEPDFVRTWAHEDMNDTNLIVNYETWACSREYFIEHHLKKPYRKAYEESLPALLSGERRIVFLNTIRSYPGKQV